MIQELFTTLNRALEGSYWIAFSAAFLWGVCSIILSPCHLSSIPLIVGFISQRGRISMCRAFVISTFFSVGILVTIAIIGIITSLAGKMLGDIGTFSNYFVAAVFFIFGLVLLGVIRLPWSGPTGTGFKGGDLFSAFMFGLVFGAALGPCSFAYMAPMLAVTFKLGASAPIYGAVLLLLYGLGHCVVIILAGVCGEFIQRYLEINERFKSAVILRKICGIVIIISGLYMIFVAK